MSCARPLKRCGRSSFYALPIKRYASRVTTAQSSITDTGDAVQEAIRRSVESIDPSSNGIGTLGDGFGLIAFAAAYNDAIAPWGTAPVVRDSQLRAFLTKEPYAMAAFGSIIARNAAMSWRIEAKTSKVEEQAHDLLMRANWGAGWLDFSSLYSMDILTQDKGQFTEIIREEDRPDAPTVAFRTLDAAYCWATGDPMEPVVYMDRVSGKYYRLKWYQVHHSLEMPMYTGMFAGTWGSYHRLQLCALSRALKGAQTYFNMEQYVEEKTGGRHTRAIHLVGGFAKKEIEDGMKLWQATNDGMLQSRYINPTVLAAVDPSAKPDVKTLELTSLPDGWDQEAALKDYLTLLAMALLTDYGELAPLPGKGIGTATQSETMDDKARQKGAGLFRKRIAHMMNTVILPDNCEFVWDEQDLKEEQYTAAIRKTRAEARGTMKANGEINEAGARMLALEQGDMSQELFDEMNTQKVVAPPPAQPFGGAGQVTGAGGPTPGMPQVQLDVPRSSTAMPNMSLTTDEGQATKDIVEEARNGLETQATDTIERSLRKVHANIRARLRDLSEEDLLDKALSTDKRRAL